MTNRKLLVYYLAFLGLIPIVVMPSIMVALIAVDIFISSLFGSILGQGMGTILGIILLFVPFGAIYLYLRKTSLFLMGKENNRANYVLLSYALATQFLVLLLVQCIPVLLRGQSLVAVMGSVIFSNTVLVGFCGVVYYLTAKDLLKKGEAKDQSVTPVKKL